MILAVIGALTEPPEDEPRPASVTTLAPTTAAPTTILTTTTTIATTTTLPPTTSPPTTARAARTATTVPFVPFVPPAPSGVPGGGSAYYANCDAARAAGAAPLSRGDPGYRAGLDRDGDGTACE